MITRSFMLIGLAQKLTASGPVGGCRLRRNGRRQPVARTAEPIPGEKILAVIKRIMILEMIALAIPAKLEAIQVGQAHMVRWTWQATYGNG